MKIQFSASGSCSFLLQGKIREPQVLESLSQIFPSNPYEIKVWILLKEFQEFIKRKGG